MRDKIKRDAVSPRKVAANVNVPRKVNAHKKEKFQVETSSMCQAVPSVSVGVESEDFVETQAECVEKLGESVMAKTRKSSTENTVGVDEAAVSASPSRDQRC